MTERVIRRLSRGHAPRTISVIRTDAIFGRDNQRWAADSQESIFAGVE